MESWDQFIDMADAYTSSTMGEKEVAAFEKDISKDGKWESAWTLYQEAKASIEVEAEAHVKARWNREYMASQEPKVRNMAPLVWLAAAVIVVLAAVVFWQIGKKPSTPEALYALHTENIQLSLGQRGTLDSELRFAKANALLNAEQYRESIPILQELLDDTSFTRLDFARLHMGISYLQTEQNQQAEQMFSQIHTESAFRYDAMWYQALLALKQNKTIPAKLHLETLQTESKTYSTRAAELLDALE